MTENNKVRESLDNTFNSAIDNWVEEVMWDFKLDDKVFDRETVKKILRFGYYTAVYTYIDQEKRTKLIEALETIAEETDVSVKEIIDLLTGFCWDEEESFELEQLTSRRV